MCQDAGEWQVLLVNGTDLFKFEAQICREVKMKRPTIPTSNHLYKSISQKIIYYNNKVTEQK